MPIAEKRRNSWLWAVGALTLIGGCLLGGNLLRNALLYAESAEKDAHDQLLKAEGQEIIRGLEVENPAPGKLGEALISRVTSHFGAGGTVLRQEVARGVPDDGETAGEIDVRVVQTGQGSALGQPTDSESFTICVRFHTEWSRNTGIVTTVREIGCP
ncbi:hypothetical protein [Actinoplanes flavus]|uniref:Mce-associated membrane protein n=1 Tax=Actinoplanes flavus TaxID=2820290 RepID=A0ABS3UFE4_9ACTN|nr:hypothetical protein [Actinoplanes flavus]MBO3737489.1 hypothetical protein [Actinoplanes flavus]